jgi:hypothetical protein
MYEPYYLCRLPKTDAVILLKEGDYKYLRNHERTLRVPDPDAEAILITKGRKHEVVAYYNLITGRNITNVS